MLIDKPIPRMFPNTLGARKEICKPRRNSARKSIRSNVVPINPNSSPATENTKSVCGSGRKRFFSTLPASPLPQNPPFPRVIRD